MTEGSSKSVGKTQEVQSAQENDPAKVEGYLIERLPGLFREDYPNNTIRRVVQQADALHLASSSKLTPDLTHNFRGSHLVNFQTDIMYPRGNIFIIDTFPGVTSPTVAVVLDRQKGAVKLEWSTSMKEIPDYTQTGIVLDDFKITVRRRSKLNDPYRAEMRVAGDTIRIYRQREELSKQDDESAPVFSIHDETEFRLGEGRYSFEKSLFSEYKQYAAHIPFLLVDGNGMITFKYDTGLSRGTIAVPRSVKLYEPKS